MLNLPANAIRGFVGFASIICMAAGAWLMWGFGAALFSLGLFMAIDCSTDEVIERCTKTTRGKVGASPHPRPNGETP